MNFEQFKNSPSGHPTRVGQGESMYWAYVPNPLPPAVEFDHELVNLVSDASLALGQLSGLGRVMQNPYLLINPFIHREAVLSSRIEGTQASVTDVYTYEAGQMPLPGLRDTAPELDVQEVVNYISALNYGLKRRDDLSITLRLIGEMHEHLMKGVRGQERTPGQFRTSQNWIRGSSPTNADYVPPPPFEMNQGLDDLEKYLHYNTTYPQLVRLALIHYQFEAIHPFLDGNGRVGRLLISLLLVHWGLLPSPLLYLSAFFESRKEEYHEKLFAVGTTGTWQDWIKFFLQGVSEQAKDAVQRAQKLQDIQQDWKQRVHGMPHAPARLLHLVDYLFERPVTTIPQVKSNLKVSYPTAQDYVEKLEKAGILRQSGDTPQGKIFAADQILQVIDEQQY